MRCGSTEGPFERQRQPWGLYCVCDSCWLWLRNVSWRLHRAARRKATLVAPEVCEDCRRKRKLTAHHFDYLRPFAVQWVCSTCHARAHRQVVPLRVLRSQQELTCRRHAVRPVYASATR